MDDDTWTLGELVAQAAAALGDRPSAGGQGRAVPDERALRYYTTLGLLDRPAAMRGRTALYGRRHLAQVVAIKRMQAAGESLAAIQALLPTLDDGELARRSGVAVPGRRPVTARAGFWREAPSPPSPPSPPSATPAPSSPARPLAAAATGFVPHVALVLAPGVTVHVAIERAATDADADALRAAAAPLLAELARRRLVTVAAAGAAADDSPDDDSDPARPRAGGDPQ